MPNSEKVFLEVRKYFTTWVTEVVLANTAGYFDINKISEGTALALLNLIFDSNLRDLNLLKPNFPGIDLGDNEKAMVAFQVTSQTDNTKILSSLDTFRNKNYKDIFPSGIRFLIINNKKSVRKNFKAFDKFSDIFNPQTGIFYPEDLQNLIRQLYYKDEPRFYEIKEFLKREFGTAIKKANNKKPLIDFDSPLDKFTFYKRILTGSHQNSLSAFVQFQCKLNDEDITTNDLRDVIFNNDGTVILGPSGCGKSILSRRIALNFLDYGMSVILEGKYYETDLNNLFEREIGVLGFNSSSAFFEIANKLNLTVLFVIDGFNECEQTKKPKLLLELEKVKFDYQVKILIISQKPDKLFDPLGLSKVYVDYPSTETKKAIANMYSGKAANAKLEPILNAVSSALEAKMLGEIAIDDIDRVSRFTLFEIFIKQKLDSAKTDGFFLLAKIAQVLSEKVSFSLPERIIDEILRVNSIPQSTYVSCLENKILDRSLGKVSFGHEMFFNFFVAESVIRFADGVSSILTQINTPKNYDKKLLIIGSISDTDSLDTILASITDVNLLNALAFGEGGEYCKKWIDKKLLNILKKIECEIEQVKYELNTHEISGVGFIENTLIHWTNEQYAFIHVIPYKLVHGQFLKKFFDLVRKMDVKAQDEVKNLWEEGKQRGISVRFGVFSATYIGLSHTKTAITRIVSDLRSGLVTFNNEMSLTDEMIQQLLSKRSLSYGQFYFLLELLRWDEKLRFLYPYALDLLKNKWRNTPSQLTHEILNRAAHFHKTEKERQDIIEALNLMHSQTSDVWLSTSIFDALNQIGALEDDATEYIPVVVEQLEKLLNDVDSEDNWNEANGLYNCQFDHPYDYAFQTAISNLEQDQKEVFYQMALKGLTSAFFGSFLLTESAKLLKERICPLISKWTEVPIIEKSYPQDSLRMFLLSHLLLAKHNYPLVSRFADADVQSEKSLFAAAELYYWINRSDLNFAQIIDFSREAQTILFNPLNVYTIDTICECRHSILQSSINSLFENASIMFIEDCYQDAVVAACRSTLQKLDWQQDISGISYRTDLNTKAIHLLEKAGSLIDVDVLRNLIEHPEYGQSAVKAIKQLSQRID